MVESIPYFTRAWDLDPLNQAYGAGPLFTLLALRRFPEALEQARMIKTRLPADEDGYIATARINAFVTQSLGPLRELLKRADLAADTRRSFEAQLAQREGRYRDAIAQWESRTDADPLLRLESIAFLFRAAGDNGAAEERFRSLERDLADRVRAGADDADDNYKHLALAQSMLGTRAAAIETIERARARWPESLDPSMAHRCPFTAAWCWRAPDELPRRMPKLKGFCTCPTAHPLTAYGSFTYPRCSNSRTSICLVCRGLPPRPEPRAGALSNAGVRFNPDCV
jgi:tetratricopeptide (TPR) repeat protein